MWNWPFEPCNADSKLNEISALAVMAVAEGKLSPWIQMDVEAAVLDCWLHPAEKGLPTPTWTITQHCAWVDKALVQAKGAANDADWLLVIDSLEHIGHVKRALRLPESESALRTRRARASRRLKKAIADLREHRRKREAAFCRFAKKKAKKAKKGRRRSRGR